MPSWLLRFGVVCGVLTGLTLGPPALVEVFTGETTATSFVIGLGTVFGPPALTALYLHHGLAADRFSAVAYAMNILGLTLFGAVAFSLNIVLFHLDQPTVARLLAGPARLALLTAAVVFVAGTVLFAASMLRSRRFPRVPVYAYAVSLPLLALLARLPDTPLTSAVHVTAAAALIWLSLSAWPGTGGIAVARRGGTESGHVTRGRG
ncbi:hypothetical protein ABGB17_10925 [Sphaerisporangium sp. B11E5]|uniref:hypothetical protein n=1 Tax=Sphaerisporangium sp. B11E5 TaxID=3153563 RepID=UPI00325D5BB7